MRELELFIHGEIVAATSGETFDSINPATGEIVARVGQASVDDVDRAVQSARHRKADLGGVDG